MMRGMILLFVIFGIEASFGSPAEANPVVRVTVSKNQITLRQTTTLTLNVEWPADEGPYSFAFPQLELHQLTLDRQGESQETFENGGRTWQRKTFALDLRPTAPGEGSIEAFRLPFFDPFGQQRGEFNIEKMRVAVTQPLRLLRILIPAILVGLGGMGLVISRTVRRSKKAAPVLPPTPEETAIQHVKQLFAERSESKEILSGVGRELHHYLMGRYEIQERHLTNHELLNRLARQAVPREEQEWLRRLIHQIDDAKFAGVGVSPEGLTRLQNDVLGYFEGKRTQGG